MISGEGPTALFDQVEQEVETVAERWLEPVIDILFGESGQATASSRAEVHLI